MATAAKPKPKKGKARKQRIAREPASRKPVAFAVGPMPEPREAADQREVPLDAILPSPWQPRTVFEETALAELTESIRQVGVATPITVRIDPQMADLYASQGPTARQYQLIAGERRVRAARAAGLSWIPALVVDVDDATAATMTIVENLQRADLSPIEEARAFQNYLTAAEAAGAPLTQTELAERLGVSQGHVANRLRLLRLPESIQAHVISGKMPTSHALAVVPFAAHPAAIDVIAKDLDRAMARGDDLEPVEDFAESLKWTLEAEFFNLEDTHYSYEASGHVPAFEPTPDQVEALGIIEIDAPHLKGNKTIPTTRMATNKKLAEKLQKAHALKWAEAKRSKAGKKGHKTTAGSTSAAKKPEPTSAEKAAKAKAVARRKVENLWAWKCDWLRYLISRNLHADHVPAELRARDLGLILMWLAMNRPATHNDAVNRAHDLRSVAPNLIGRSTRRNAWFEPIASTNEEMFWDIVAAWLARLFWDAHAESPAEVIDNDAVVLIAEHLEINLAAEWKANRAGPMTEAWLNLHDKAELETIGEMLPAKLQPPAGSTRAQLLEALAEAEIPYPASIEKAKRPK